MRDQFPTYLAGQHNDFKFISDFQRATTRLFAAHGLGVKLSRTANDIRKTWHDQAADWSLRIPTKEGHVRSKRNALCLSHIKQAGLLMWTINELQPIGKIWNLTAEDSEMLHEMDVEIGTRDSGIITAYPHQFTAYQITRSVFERYQMQRFGEYLFTDRPVPKSDHFTRNLCVLLEAKKMPFEACYMVFKSFDLYGFNPDQQDNAEQLNKRPDSGA